MTIRPLAFRFFCLAVFCASLAAGTARTAVQPQHSPADASPGKPNAGLTVVSGNRHQLRAGSAQSVTLTLASAVTDGLLHLALSTSSDDLEMLSPAVYQFDLQQEPATLTLELMPHRDGRYYLMLNATVDREHLAPQAQSLVVLIHVGESQTSPRLLKADPAHEVISLPARETIRRQ